MIIETPCPDCPYQPHNEKRNRSPGGSYSHLAAASDPFPIFLDPTLNSGEVLDPPCLAVSDLACSSPQHHKQKRGEMNAHTPHIFTKKYQEYLINGVEGKLARVIQSKPPLYKAMITKFPKGEYHP
jgi:hypothetical protein